MATPEGIAKTLAFLTEIYAGRPVTNLTARAWEIMACDVSDDELFQAAVTTAKLSATKFFPSVAEVLGRVPRRQVAVDVDALRKRIESLGSHNVHVGWIWPSVARVAEVFGEGVAAAYGAVGASRLGGDAGVGADIALREFAAEVQTVVARDGRAMLTAGTEKVPEIRPYNPHLLKGDS